MKIIKLTELGAPDPYIFSVDEEDDISQCLVESIDPIFHVKTERVYNSYGDDCYKVNFIDDTFMQVPKARFVAQWAPDDEEQE